MSHRGIPWLSILLAIVSIAAIFLIVDFAYAQFYFPVTSGLSDYYNFGTLRYGNLFGLSGTVPFIIAPDYYWSAFTFWGPIIGAVVISFLFAYGDIYFAGYHPVASGLLIILVMRFMPGGLVGVAGSVSGLWRNRRRAA